MKAPSPFFTLRQLNEHMKQVQEMMTNPTAQQPTAPRLIRLAQLATTPTTAGKLPVSKPTIWRWVKEGKFPKPFKMHGATVWDVAEVDAFIKQMAEARA